MVLELPAVVTILGIPILAVLWKYSALPKIDWKYLVAGALLLLASDAIVVLGAQLDAIQAMGAATAASTVGAVVAVIAALLVLGGALKEAAAKMK